LNRRLLAPQIFAFEHDQIERAYRPAPRRRPRIRSNTASPFWS
jgi:hypothetical protein